MSSISGIKWNDLNGDRVQNPGEPGLANQIIYLDDNRNGRRDESEQFTTTDANGNYTFTNLPNGSYIVAEVPQPGWMQTAPDPRFGPKPPLPESSVLIPVQNRRDLVFDPKRYRLYITTEDGDLERYDLLNQTLLEPIDVGNSLNGADITPDSDILYIAEGLRGATQGFIRKLNLNTGIVTRLTYNLDFLEGGAWDIQIANSGKAFFTTTFEGSGWNPLRQIDLNTDALSIRTIPGQFSEFRGESRIHRSSDRSQLLIVEPDISSGPITLYTTPTDSFVGSREMERFLSGRAAISREGAPIALPTSGITILDQNLNTRRSINLQADALTFDPVRDILYIANFTIDQIIAFDTQTWGELYRIEIGEDVSSSIPLFSWQEMLVSNDGQFLFLSTDAGVRIYGLTGAQEVVINDGQVAAGVNFGNRLLPPPTASISGTQWNDLDGDRIRDENEPGLANWTIYLDQNQNGRLDAGEHKTTTDENGSYRFTGLVPGQYFVAALQPIGWQQTAPVTQPQRRNLLIPISGAQDLVFDPLRDLLYIPTATGNLERFDPSSQRLLKPFKVGNVLNGADITPDSNAVYIAEGQTRATQGFIRRVDLNNGTSSNQTYNLDFGEGGPIDLNISANGRAFITSVFNGSGSTPLRQLNLNTNQIRVRTDISSIYAGNITRSGDYSTVFILEQGLSSTNGFLYQAATNTFQTRADIRGGTLALNQNGNRIALSGVSIVDQNFQSIENLSVAAVGAVFDPSGNILYVADNNTDDIVAFDTQSWQEIFRFDVGEDLTPPFSYSFAKGTVLSISDDGRFLFLRTQSGVRMLGIEPELIPTHHSVKAIAGQDITGLDFGSRRETYNNILGTSGNDWLRGTAKQDEIWGYEGQDILAGSTGSDVLWGGRGRDILRGGLDDDQLSGGRGMDWLLGGHGNDTLRGGEGNDTFAFNHPSEGVDTILDFSVEQDKIQVSRTGFGSTLVAGTSLTAEQFRQAATAQTASDRFLYDSQTGALWFDADGSGAVTAVQIAQLAAGLNLTPANFVIAA